MKKDQIKDIGIKDSALPLDGSVVFVCRLMEVDGRLKAVTDIRQPLNKEEATLLAHETAQLVALMAVQLATTPFACHAGCTFAAIVEEAHREFHESEPDEYHRVVSAGLLTKATATGSKH